MDASDIYKNVKDLEYQTILSMQNIVLGFIGVAVITVLFLPEIPENWPSRENIIFLLALLAVFFFFYFRDGLNKKIDSLRRMRIS